MEQGETDVDPGDLAAGRDPSILRSELGDVKYSNRPPSGCMHRVSDGRHGGVELRHMEAPKRTVPEPQVVRCQRVQGLDCV